MLLTLPDDCLHEIFDYLNLQDCFILANVCKDLRNFNLSRLQSSNFDFAYWRKHNAHKPVPKHLKRLMASTTGEIRCNGDFLFSIRTYFNRLEFTGVTSLILTACNLEPIAADELEHLITDLFPQLIKLKLQGDFQGNFIWYMKKLKTLEIDTRAFDKDSIENLRMINLRRLSLKQPLKDWPVIRELTKLNELQELQICANDYTQFALNSGFKLLKQLHKLTVTPSADSYHIFFKDSDFYRKIDAIYFNMRLGLLHKSEQRLLSDMTRLRTLYFINDDGSTLSEFCKTDPYAWQSIEEIYYINAESQTSVDLEQQQEDLLDLLKYTPNLRKLDISGSSYGDDLLKRFAEMFHAQRRNKEIVVHCYNTKVTQEMQHSYLPHLLTISVDEQFDLPPVPTLNSVEIFFEEPHSIEDLISYLGELLEIISRVFDVRYLWDVLHEKQQKLQRIRNEELILESHAGDIPVERFNLWQGLLLNVRENMYRQVEIITEMVLNYTYLN